MNTMRDALTQYVGLRRALGTRLDEPADWAGDAPRYAASSQSRQANENIHEQNR